MVTTSAEVIRKLGYPATRGRGEILRILAESPLPLSPKEILGLFPAPKPDASTVYRNLSLLASLGLVRSVALHERSRRYEIATDGAHRHRVVCKGCGKIESFQPRRCDLSPLESDIRSTLDFDVEEHSLEFFGVCPQCRRREKGR
ncbi:MAG TPA: Fur family transcriptional regulator [Candidatus Limnocylindria bacterium]|nr:Fur family transcriptional regulator [Candidatus Limnocylindria bacterium]